MPAQNGRTAAASGAAGVDILRLIKDHHAAVLVLRHQVDPLLQQQIVQKPAPDPSQIAGEYCVVIIHIRIGRAEVTVYGVRRGRCCCQGFAKMSLVLHNKLLVFLCT